MRRWFIRMRYRFSNWWDRGDEITRRVGVEQVLLNMYAGKEPLPTRERCLELALELGVPTWARTPGSVVQRP